jgi:Pyruvate/2-oxoacid:ferredoxin oxidoreductase delta subunit/flavodoxin
MTEIFYFSGTGFTLKAAKIMKKELNDEVVLSPVIGAMRSGYDRSGAERIGLLLPMHAFGLPLAFRDFLRSFHFKNAKYIFSLVTRGGAPARIHKEIGKYLKKQNKKLNAFCFATTRNTFDVIFKVHMDPEFEKLHLEFEKTVRNFAKTVNANENTINLGYRNRFLEYILFPFLKMLNHATGYFNLQNSFYADKKCTGCGKCKQMCLSGKIKLSKGRPWWQKEIQCQFCLACLHLCPQKAIQVRKSKTPELGRIFDKDTSCAEIAKQKNLVNSGN